MVMQSLEGMAIERIPEYPIKYFRLFFYGFILTNDKVSQPCHCFCAHFDIAPAEKGEINSPIAR